MEHFSDRKEIFVFDYFFKTPKIVIRRVQYCLVLTRL